MWRKKAKKNIIHLDTLHCTKFIVRASDEMFNLVPSLQLNETAFTNKLLINDEKSTIFTSFFSSSFLSFPVSFHRMERKNNLHFYFSCTKSHRIDDDYILLYFFHLFCYFCWFKYRYTLYAILLCRHDLGLSVRRVVCAVFYIFWTFITYYHHHISQFE